MERKERHLSRRSHSAQNGCPGCLLCRGASAQAVKSRRAAPAPVVQLRPGAAARFFVV